MKAGCLGLVEAGQLDDPAAAEMRNTKTEYVQGGEETFVRSLQIDETTQATLSTIGDGDVDVVEGGAIYDEKKDTKIWSDGGKIEKAEAEVRDRTGTRFAAVPESGDHPGFALASTSAGAFVFDYLKESQTHCEMYPGAINIQKFLKENPGIYVHELGRNSLQDDGRTTIDWLEESIDHDEAVSRLNNGVGLTLDFAATEIALRAYITQSGWIEVYEPGDMETADFVEWVEKNILPYAYIPQDDD